MTSESLLDGLHVLDLAGEPAQMAARILGDLGADVTRVACAGSGRSVDRLAWDAGKRLVAVGPDDDELASCWPRPTSSSTPRAGPARSSSTPPARPHAVWVSVTPFGRDRAPRRRGGRRTSA